MYSKARPRASIPILLSQCPGRCVQQCRLPSAAQEQGACSNVGKEVLCMRMLQNMLRGQLQVFRLGFKGASRQQLSHWPSAAQPMHSAGERKVVHSLVRRQNQ